MSRARAVRFAKTELAEFVASALSGLTGAHVTVTSATQCLDDPKVVQVEGCLTHPCLPDDEWTDFVFDVHIREVLG